MKLLQQRLFKSRLHQTRNVYASLDISSISFLFIIVLLIPRTFLYILYNISARYNSEYRLFKKFLSSIHCRDFEIQFLANKDREEEGNKEGVVCTADPSGGKENGLRLINRRRVEGLDAKEKRDRSKGRARNLC